MAAAGPFLLLIVPFFYARVIDFPGTIKNTIWYIQQPHSIHMYFVLILYLSSIVIVLISHKTLSLPVLCCHFLLLTLSHPSYRGTNRPPPLLTCCAAPYHINTLLYTCLVCNGIIGKFIHYNFFCEIILWCTSRDVAISCLLSLLPMKQNLFYWSKQLHCLFI